MDDSFARNTSKKDAQIMGEMGEISAFARAEFNREATELDPRTDEVIVGGRFALKF